MTLFRRYDSKLDVEELLTLHFKEQLTGAEEITVSDVTHDGDLCVIRASMGETHMIVEAVRPERIKFGVGDITMEVAKANADGFDTIGRLAVWGDSNDTDAEIITAATLAQAFTVEKIETVIVGYPNGDGRAGLIQAHNFKIEDNRIRELLQNG